MGKGGDMARTQTLKHGAAMMAAGALLAAAWPAAAATQTPAAALDQKRVSELCTAMTLGVAKLPRTAGTQDVEAALVFAISQSKADPRTVEAALRCVRGSGTAFQQALANVRQGYSIGTGAIASGGGGFGSGGFGFGSTPVTGIGGGGGSTYTR
jgi:hypothetical protein